MWKARGGEGRRGGCFWGLGRRGGVGDAGGRGASSEGGGRC